MYVGKDQQKAWTFNQNTHLGAQKLWMLLLSPLTTGAGMPVAREYFSPKLRLVLTIFLPACSDSSTGKPLALGYPRMF